jgi:hypothetical protein
MVSRAKSGQKVLPGPKPGDASRKAIAALLAKIDAVLADLDPAMQAEADN